VLSVALAGLLAASPAASIALPGVSGVGLEAGEAELYSGLLATRIRSHGLTVIAAEDIASVLGLERQRQLLGCASECSVELAAALGTDGVLLARVGRLGDTYSLSVRVISAKDATVLADTSETAPTRAQMPFALEHLAWSLAKQLDWPWAGRGVQVGDEPRLAAKPSLRPWALVPAGVALISLGVGLGLRFVAQDTLVQLRVAPDASRALTLRDAGNLQETLSYTLLGVGGAAAVTAVLLAVLGGGPNESTVSMGFAPISGGAFATVRFSCP
jgi:hypothetical protein